MVKYLHINITIIGNLPERGGNMFENNVAFHLHSNYSDGGSTVPEIVGELIRNNVKIAVLCDHDEIGGVKYFKDATKKAGIKSIPCFELSTCYAKRFYVHILAYGFDIKKRASIETALQRNWQAHDDCFDETLEMVNRKLGLRLTREEIRQITNRTGNANFTFPLFYHLNKNLGFDSAKLWELIYRDEKSPMNQLLLRGKLLTLEEGMEFITSIGATPVFAHPGFFAKYSLSGEGTIRQLERLFEIMADLGLQGAEYFYPYPQEQKIMPFIEASRHLTKKHGLWELSGSDYHGSYKTNDCGIAMPGLSLAEALEFKSFCER
jgi:hypothetical protein